MRILDLVERFKRIGVEGPKGIEVIDCPELVDVAQDVVGEASGSPNIVSCFSSVVTTSSDLHLDGFVT